MTQKINRVLVAVDFQQLSMVALEQSYEIVKFIKGELHLIYVAEQGDFFTEMLRTKEHTEIIKSEAEKKLAALATETESKTGFKVVPHVVFGKAYEKILTLAKELRARFIVIGQNTIYQKENKRMGSNLSHVIMEAKCPVIVVHNEEHMASFRDIVIPLDLKKHIREKIFNGISFALHFHSTIHIVSVIMGGVPFEKSRIFKRMKAVQKTFLENGIPCNIKLFPKTKTPLHLVITDYAHSIHAGLLMIMTHQENSSDNYIGSVAQKIIISSDVPVLSLTSAAVKEEEFLMSPIVNPMKIIKKFKLTE